MDKNKNMISFVLNEKAYAILNKVVKKSDLTRSMFIKSAIKNYIATKHGDKVKPSDLIEFEKDKRFKND